MKYIDLGDDSCPKFYLDASTTLLVVDDYQTGSYEGSGYGLVLNADLSVDEYNLGHCSCNGPYEGVSDSWKTLEEFKNENSVLRGKANSELNARFIEEAEKLINKVD